MARMTVIFTASKEDSKTDLHGLLADHGCIEGEVEIHPTTFFIAYNSKTNKSIFNVEVSQRIKNANSVCAFCVVTTENPLDIYNLASTNENVVCVEPNINWQSLSYLEGISEKHSLLLEDLRVLEDRCRNLDERSSVRRQHFQQEYEYLEEEIDQLESKIRGIAITQEQSRNN